MGADFVQGRVELSQFLVVSFLFSTWKNPLTGIELPFTTIFWMLSLIIYTGVCGATDSVPRSKCSTKHYRLSTFVLYTCRYSMMAVLQFYIYCIQYHWIGCIYSCFVNKQHILICNIVFLNLTIQFKQINGCNILIYRNNPCWHPIIIVIFLNLNPGGSLLVYLTTIVNRDQ